MAKTRITKARVEQAARSGPGKAWDWLGDVEVPGFGVKVYGNGRKTFALRYRSPQGQQRMLTLGPFGPLTVQAAREMAPRN